MIEKCIALARKYGATKLILFGSASKDPGHANDIDLACDGIEGWKLFEFGAELEELSAMPVDIVPLKPPTRFTKYVEKKGRIIYEL
ncbi:MAG: nucleotidyltransferase family protein [bacterium]